MMQKLMKGVIAVIFMGLLLGACAKTKLTNIWIDKAYQDGPVSDILVIGISYDDDTRRFFESMFVKQLNAVGAEAVSSANVIPMPANLKIEKEAILEAVKKYGNDSVLITHMTGAEERQTYAPPDFYHRGGYYGYYGSIFGNRGYYSSHSYIRLKTTLYGVSTEKPIWYGESKTLEQASYRKLFDDVMDVVIKDLRKNKILTTKR